MAKDIERILLIEPKATNYHVFSKYIIARLGLPQLGTILKELDYDIQIKIEEAESKKRLNCGEIEDSRPDAVGLSLTSSTAPHGYDTADRLRRRLKVPIIFGGAHPSFMAEEALMHGDYVIRKEGDVSFPQLIEALNGNGRLEDIKGLSYKGKNGFVHNPDADIVMDLDSLPNPDLTLIDNYQKLDVIPISTSRGCPHGCSFCSVIKMFGRNYRFKSPEKVVEDMKQYPGKSIFIVDDNFTANKERAKELLRLMIKEKINNDWSAQTRTDIYKDRELLELMKKTHCTYVYLGLESINPESLVDCNKKQTLEDITKSVKALQEYDIGTHGMFVLGFPSDTIQTVRQTPKFAKRLGLTTVQIMFLTPLPGTDTFYELEKQNRIFCKDWSMYDAHHVVFHPEKMSAYELQKEGMKAMREFYSLSSVLKSVISPGFATGALSYGLREIDLYMSRKLRNLGKFGDAVRFIPNRISSYISKTQFYGAISKGFGWATLRKSKKEVMDYIRDEILPKIKSPFGYKKPVSPGN
jgi:radical SAM superfamily enzyme YgiQ (UPF0313 family)